MVARTYNEPKLLCNITSPVSYLSQEGSKQDQ